jgi:hypothetical protein
MRGACGIYGANSNTRTIWSGNLKRQVGRLRRLCDDTIKKDLEEIGLEGVGWINVAHMRICDGRCRDADVRSACTKCGEFRDKLRNSKLLKKDSPPGSQSIRIIFMVM